jgi:phage repressor protein C with HTH and peptisase S24 domain
MEKFQRINNIKQHYAFNRDTDFANFLGISPQVLYNWKARNTFDTELIYSKCFEINPEWLLTGKGNMLKNGFSAKQRGVNQNGFTHFDTTVSAGFKFMEYENEKFFIPTFKEADSLIQVTGDAMYPKYNNGDIVACKKLLLDDLFFQWDRVYVLETSQGSLVKRVKKGSDLDHILLMSENESFESFELNVSKIFAVALVIGVIRLM